MKLVRSLLGIAVAVAICLGVWLAQPLRRTSVDEAAVSRTEIAEAGQNGQFGKPVENLEPREAAAVAVEAESSAPMTRMDRDRDEVLAAFSGWAGRFVGADAASRAALKAEGVMLAKERRPVFQQLIQTDPRRALELAVPRVVRQELPAEVTEQLERPVSAVGDLNVYFGRPAPGVEVPADGLALRYFEADGVSYKARVFGQLANVVSRTSMPLQGVAVDREFAVAENAVRQLEVGERIPAGTVVEQTCPVSGETTKVISEGEAVDAQTPVVEIGGRLITLCNGSHVRVLEEDFRTFVQASGPGGGGFFVDNYPGTSSRAIGNFRCLYIRVTYPDQMAEPNSEEQAYADMRDNARYYLESSFGKMTQTVNVTSLLVLPHTLSWYKAKDAEVDGLGLIHSESRELARTHGYDPGQYDCIIVRINKGPRLEGISWGGGTSVWITWNGMDVLNHECGHSLGRNHANYWESFDGTPYGYGQNAEYGNPFDVMGGSGGFSAHYNTVSKRALGWLPDNNVHFVNGSGVYRIYAYDQPTLEQGKRYALNVAKDSVRQYNVEYHPARGGYLADSALVIYSGMGSNAGHLLDTTQGSLGGKDDGGIAVGRTYSDWEADMHFTVLSKNATTPPSLDIAYKRGPFPPNSAPTATPAPSATPTAVGGSVTVAATASDADGDALAYFWEFDDGVLGTNSSVFTRTFSNVAQVTAMLTVSDMKGGSVRRSAVINVGSHGKQMISGTVSAGGQPVQGVYVSGGGKGSYSNVDGTYTLAGISTGTQSLTAVLPGYTFTPSFTNPLNVVVGTNTADWSASATTSVSLAKIADAAEGGASGTFRFTRTGSTAADLVVLVSPAGGTAVKGTDYTFTPDYTTSGSFRAFTIPAGSATLDVVVAATNDTAAEGPETISLQLAGAAGYVTSTPNAVSMTVADNDTGLPQVSVVASDPYASEGPSPETGTFIFSRAVATGSALNVTVAWSGAATSASDYLALPTTVTIPGGQSSVSVTVTPVDDSLIEVPETVIATISSNAAYVRDSSATTATVTITDDDTPVVTVSVPDPTASESGADSGLFLISRSGSTAAALKVYYGLSGSALHGTDYAALSGEVTIPAGSVSAPVVIAPYNDDIAEPPETVTLAVTSFNDAYNIGAQFQGTVTISDNGDTPLVSVRSGTVGVEGSTNPTFIFHSIGRGSGNFTVNYTVSGTATPGSDYTALSGSISLPVNGSNDTTLTVSLVNDVVVEPTENIVITITASANYRVYNESSADVMILDNDAADRVMVSTYNHFPSESGPVFGTFYFSRTGTAGNLTVNYGLSGTATNGVDYQTLSGTAVIPDTQTGVNVVMTPIDDSVVEGTETVTVTVLPGTGYTPDKPSSATFSIDDNEAPSLTVGFQQMAVVTTEQPGALGEYRDYAVVLSAVSALTVTVDFNSGGGSATGDDVDWAFIDPANANAVIPGGTLTFLPGVTSRNIRIRVKNDGVAEGGETAILQLLNASNATLAPGRGQLTVTIFDNSIPALVTEERWNSGAVFTNNTWDTVSPDYTAYLTSFTTAQDVADNYSRRLRGQIVAPATGVYNFWIASDDSSRLYVSTDSTAAHKVQIASLSGWTNFQNWDANSSQKSANISLVAGQSYYVEVQHQEGGGGDHVSVAWQGPGFSRVPISFTETNSAPRFVRLAASASTRLESDGSEPMLQVVLDRPAGATPVTVDFSVGGTATNGSDYALTPGTISFAAGEQMKAIPLVLLTDAIGEGPESIVVSISNAVGATLASPSSHTITLLDAAAPSVDSLFANPSSTQAVGTVIATGTATPTAGRTIAGWSFVSGNTGNAFAINSSGQLTLATPAALPNPGGMQLIVRATDDIGASGDGVFNIICNAGTQAVVEQRWTGSTAFWNEDWSGTAAYSGKLATLTTSQNVADNYSRRLIALLKPQTSGDYTFWIAGDDDCRLYLSTDGYQANKVQIASVNGWTNFQSWDQSGTQKSSAIPLVAGKVYWIEAQQVEGGGGDHVSVAWSGPGISRTAIPSTVLLPTAAGVNFTVPSATFANTAPTISDVTNLSIAEDGATSAIPFTIGDAETSASSLAVSASSSNPSLVPNGNIVLGGSGAGRTVTITPLANQAGSATITLTVNDGLLTASDTFVLTVTGANDAPSISSIATQTIPLNTSTVPLQFNIADVETGGNALTVSKSSSNTTLVPASGIVINGTGNVRTVTVTPAADQVGTTTITLGVNDGITTTNTAFFVNVTGTPIQTWRQQYFGSTVATGSAADLADADNDGELNILEFSTGQSPLAGTRVLPALARTATTMDITFTRSVAAVSDGVSYTVEWSDTLSNDWSSVGVTTSVISDNGTTQQVKASIATASSVKKRFARLKVSKP